MKKPYPVKERLIKGLFVLLFSFVFSICRVIISIIALMQFFFDLISGEPSTRLCKFSSKLSDYVSEIIAFVTYQSDIKPFPFSDLPNNT
jgi:hypothetical protein|tara:strand:+ start:306 stop:572 length:267 start_codon:yes stop_codon:yes gene_type:complete